MLVPQSFRITIMMISPLGKYNGGERLTERTVFRKKLEGFHMVEVDGERLIQGSDLIVVIKVEVK